MKGLVTYNKENPVCEISNWNRHKEPVLFSQCSIQKLKNSNLKTQF